MNELNSILYPLIVDKASEATLNIVQPVMNLSVMHSLQTQYKMLKATQNWLQRRESFLYGAFTGTEVANTKRAGNPITGAKAGARARMQAVFKRTKLRNKWAKKRKGLRMPYTDHTGQASGSITIDSRWVGSSSGLGSSANINIGIGGFIDMIKGHEYVENLDNISRKKYGKGIIQFALHRAKIPIRQKIRWKDSYATVKSRLGDFQLGRKKHEISKAKMLRMIATANAPGNINTKNTTKMD